MEETESTQAASQPYYILDEKIRLFCEKTLQEDKNNPYVKNPTLQGLKTILKVAQERNDDIHKRISPQSDDILSYKVKVSYHRSCRANYSSKENCRYAPTSIDPEPTKEPITDATQSKRLRLSRDTGFDIRSQCFICSEKATKREGLTPISTGSGEHTRSKVLNAASERFDELMHHRMLTHQDLFAYDAKYHKRCLAHYISERNISAARNKHLAEKKLNIHERSFIELTEELAKTVLSKDMTVTTLSAVIESYVRKLGTADEPAKYKSWKLKKKLIQHFGDKLIFIERPGKSDLICSGAITVSHAMKEASLLREKQTEDRETIPSQTTNTLTETQILHKAAGILRKTMEKVEDEPQLYISSDKLSPLQCSKYVPNNLYDFVSWCVNADAFRKMQTCDEDPALKNNLTVITFCHDLIAQCCSRRTPITLGLGIMVHHEFGSKALINKLHKMGHCVSYAEVCQFLTSVAADQLQRSKGVYIPNGLTRTAEHGMIDAAIDNFDQNEDTLDGKNTTHSMAIVVYRRGDVDTAHNPIQRIPARSLTALDSCDLDNEVQRYIKPIRRPEPSAVLPQMLKTDSTIAKAAEDQDLLWKMSRIMNEKEQRIPGWSAFNAYISMSDIPLATVQYMPFIRASPSDLSTIYTALLKLTQLAQELGQRHILVTADLAIYSKAQQILWTKPEALDGKVTMRMGGMHITMAFLASIGKVYADGGLFDIITESGVYAEATARQMLQGKQLSRGVRNIKIVSEALFRLFWMALVSWLNKQGQSPLTAGQERLLQDVQHAFHCNNQDSARQFFREVEADTPELRRKIQQFSESGVQQSATFKYWLNFLKGADLLLRMLRSEREANFELHLNCMSEAIPWFWAAGRINYAKYMPVYIAEMKALEKSQPESYKFMRDGGFVVRRSCERTFNCVATDQALEQTINREGKSQGGIVGFTLRKGALLRWLITRHVTSEYCDAMTEFFDGAAHAPKLHKEHGAARMDRDESETVQIMKFVQNRLNPFDLETVPDDLINIASGQVASQTVAKDLSNFLEDGEKRKATFIEERLKGGTPKSFWDPQKRQKMATFTDMKACISSSKSKQLHMDSDVLFRRLLAVSKQRDVSLQNVMCHELAAIPPSLFYDDGAMRKNTKADFAKKLESVVEMMQELPDITEKSAYVIDGMAMLQSLHDSTFQTFSELAECILKKILSLLNREKEIHCVVMVFDRYDNTQSIKDMERQRRGASGGKATHVIAGNTNVPNYRKYMRSNGNKSALCKFVSNYIVTAAPQRLHPEDSIILAGGFDQGEEVKSICTAGVSSLTSLYSNQEEADTRMVLHAIHLAESYSRVIVRSDDTDVEVLLIYYASKGMFGSSLVYMHAGHGMRERFVPINKIAKNLGKDMSSCLPACHSLTGCDTTSSLYKIGKTTAFQKLKNNITELKDLAHFGLSSSLEDSLAVAREFALLLYGKRKKDNGQMCTNLDELRFIIASTTDASSANLPPTEDAFEQHVKRCMHQTAVWCHSHMPKPPLGSPIGKGWIIRDGTIEPVLFTKPPAPTELRDITNLYCKDANCGEGGKCHCLSVGLPCTEFCTCYGECNNVLQNEPEEPDI